MVSNVIANADGMPVLGILMLDTRFPRIAGDAGNPSTWPFPTRIAVVGGASPQRVVARRAAGLTDSFVASGRDLVAAGATALITTCGFLVLRQRELAARLPVPFAASSLLQLPVLERALPAGKRPGVITIAAASLTRAHLLAAGADPDTPVIGVDPAGEFAQAILGDRATLDVATAEREVLAAGERLLGLHPDVGAIVLECANMPPYARALSARLGLPVHDMVSFGRWFYSGLRPPAFALD
jgi:hypothetical protein